MTSRRTFGVSIFITMVLAMGSTLVQAQGDRTGALYQQPPPLKLEGEVKSRFPDYFKGPATENMLTEGFFPIGWSKDGKFAYYTEPVDEACGCYYAGLFILDLKTDKAVWSYNYDSSAQPNPDAAPQSLQALWLEKQKLFSDKLREHGIEPQEGAAMSPFPLKHEGDQLTADLSLKEGKDEHGTGVGHALLQLSSQRNGKKTVFEKTYSPEKEMVLPLDIKVLGYIRSTFEPRIAIISINVRRGHEGPPHVARVQVNGASLVTGFN